MKLNATHRLNNHFVHAWQYRIGSTLPHWVRDVFQVINGKFIQESRCGMLVELEVGDWAINDGKSCLVLSETEMQTTFTKL